jgi:selenocysteine lyase/cysteine desulfurase
LSFSSLFSRSLGANPGRLHFAAHSHHLWPDASFEGQVQAWEDAARLADRKWDKVMDEVWPAAQAEVAAELGIGRPDEIVFAPNTHQLLVALFSAVSAKGPPRVLTSNGEFHSATRQFTRWEEAGAAVVERVRVEPFDSFSERFLDRARSGEHDVAFVSHVLFGTGRIFRRVEELASVARPEGPWVVIDGYHAFMAIDAPIGAAAGRSAFYVGGGYKYAMAGEGCAFMRAPPGLGERPSITGWYAEFEDLTAPRRSVGYARDARRFLGATFDPSGLYRFLAVRRMLAQNGLRTDVISAHCDRLQRQLLAGIAATRLTEAELLNPLDGRQHARFLAFRSGQAQRWHEQLQARNCMTDVRGDVLRIGFGIYQDDGDVDRLLQLLGDLS